jgi:D-xylulose reductase
MEPLSVAVNAVCKIAKITAADNVAIFGAGPVGLLYDPRRGSELMFRTMAVCKAMGARRIIAVDVSQGRLEFAKQYAATDIHLSSTMQDGEERAAYSQRHVSD